MSFMSNLEITGDTNGDGIPKILLRDYQFECQEMCRNSFIRGSQRTVLCLPTGAGKTVIFSWMAQQVAKKGGTTLVLVDRIELMNQATKTMEQFGLKVANITRHTKHIPEAHVYIGMVETVYRRQKKFLHYWEEFGDLRLVVLDEAHRGNYIKIMDAIPCRVIGATATPYAARTDIHMKDYFDDIVESVGIDTLIRDGYLCPDRTFSIDHDFSKLKKRAGEYTEESQMEEFTKPELFEGVISNFKKICPWAKFLCYNVRIDHSYMMLQQFRNAGITCEHIDGTTPPAMRDKIIGGYANNKFQGLLNVGVLTAGYDEESIQAIIQNFATTSKVKYMQTNGRGARLCDYTVRWENGVCALTHKPKEFFYILDMGQNYKRHGIWSKPRSWTEEFWNPKKPLKEEDSDYKQCPNCGTLVRKGEPVCPNCLYVWPHRIQNTEKELPPAVLSEIKRKLKRTVPDHLQKPLNQMTLQDLVEYAVHFGYQPGWVYHYLKSKMRTAVYSEINRLYKEIKEGNTSREAAINEAIHALEKKQEESMDPKKRAAQRKTGFLC